MNSLATLRSILPAWFAKLPELAEGGVKVVRMQILGNRTNPGASR